ncbi:unnamed protein product [Trichobilharzia szidati]|nr:unnamed protein product [Trichobilharzia szidati]
MALAGVECRVTKGGGDGGLSQTLDEANSPDEENIALSDAETVVVVSHIYRVKDAKVQKKSPKRKAAKKSITKSSKSKIFDKKCMPKIRILLPQASY